MLSAETTISGPTGNLDFGFVGNTRYVFLRFIGKDNKKALVVYGPSEFSSFTALLGDALRYANSSQPKSIIKLGAMRPKPIVCSLSLIHPQNGSPFILLIFQHSSYAIEVPLPLQDISEILLRSKDRTNAATLVTSKLQLSQDGSWLLEGSSYNVANQFCAGIGPYGEYISPQEVSNEEQLTAAIATIDGLKQVIAFHTKNQWQAPKTIEVALAQEGDLALIAGQTYRCRSLHQRFISENNDSASLPRSWAAKLTLSRLLCDIYDREEESGYEIWSGQSDSKLFQSGIEALEQGLASPRDQIVFQLISAYFHSLGAEPEQACSTVNAVMKELFSYSSKHDPQIHRLLLNNWAMMIKEIYANTPSPQAIKAWKECRSQYSGRISPKAICFPPPDTWHAADVEQQSTDYLAEPRAEHLSTNIQEENLELPPSASSAAGANSDLLKPDSADGREPSLSSSRSSKTVKKKPIPQIIIGLVLGLGLVGGGAFLAFQQLAKPTASGIENQAQPLITETTNPEQNQSPLALAQPSQTPSESETSSATPTTAAEPSSTAQSAAETTVAPAAQSTPAAEQPLSYEAGNQTNESGSNATPEPVMQTINLTINRADKLSLGGLDPAEKYFVDRDIAGWNLVEQSSDWAKYERGGTEVILGAKPTSTLKSTRARSFASSALYANGKVVFDAKNATGKLSSEAEAILKSGSITPIYNPINQNLIGFQQGDPFPEDTPAPNQAAESSVLAFLRSNDLKGFEGTLTPQTTNIIFMDGSTLLDKIASQYGAASYCKALIKIVPDIVHGISGQRALWSASDPSIAATLLAAGVPPDGTDSQGRTKLFEAPIEMTKTLLKSKANPNFQDPEGKTPLMMANIEVTKALLAAGANPNLKDKEGKTAVDYANGDKAIISLLQKSAAVK